MTPHVPTYPTCTTDCGHCKGNHEQARLGQARMHGESVDVRVARHVAASARAKTGLAALTLSSALVTLDAEVTRLFELLAEKDATIQRVQTVLADMNNASRAWVVRDALRAALDGQEGR